MFVFYVICLIFTTTCCFSSTTVGNMTYTGILTPRCVTSYQQMYISREVPPRWYLYYHETLTAPVDGRPEQAERDDVIGFRIIGGQRTAIEDAPYQVLYGLYCGGVIIAPLWVVTAAHCKEKDDFVLAGSTERSRTSPYPICAHFTHPLWFAAHKNHSHDWDYQLLLLELAIPVTPQSRPIAIGGLGDVAPGAMVAVSGWGHIKYKTKMVDNLQKVYVPIVESEVCYALPDAVYKITPRMFCAGYLNGTKDSCQGDSGGPAVWEGKLLGLVSFGIGCAKPGQLGVYSKLPVAREWIRKTTGLPL